MQTKKKKYLNERNCAENDTGLLMSERDKNSVSDLKPTIVKAKKNSRDDQRIERSR